MIFRSVQIENFGAIGSAEVDLENRGLVLIQGQNETSTAANSNGAGKSTVVEAISWCLYGKTAKGQTGDSVINRAAGKNCQVTIWLEEDGNVFKITRGRKHKTFKSKLHVTVSSEEGENKDLTKGTDKLTQEVVERIIGCPYEVFVGAVYAGQEKMPDLPGMTDKHLKLLIEEAAGITLLERAHSVAKQRHAERRAELEEKQRAAENAVLAAETAKTRLKDAKEAEQSWVGERDARIMDLEAKARTLLRDAKAYKGDLDKLASEEDLLKEREQLKDKIDRHDQEQADLKKLEDVASDEERKAQGIKAVAETLTKGVQRRAEELEDIKGAIGKPCRSCGRAHDSDSLASAITAKEAELDEAKQNAKAEIARYKAAAESTRIARESVETFKRSMTDLSRAIALSDALNERLAKVREVKGNFEDCKARVQELTEAIKAEKAKVNPHSAKVQERAKELKAALQAATEAKNALEPAREATRVAEDVVRLYSPRGVRSHVLDTVTPYLNERTAHYLGALADGEFTAIWQTVTISAKGEPRENFSIQVTDAKGEGSFADLSGGEKRKVRIACALALQDLVATRASKALDLFIADEIDQAMDTFSLERLMGVLDEKARERGSVLIISHSDLRDWVSNCMTVIKEDGVSRIAA